MEFIMSKEKISKKLKDSNEKIKDFLINGTNKTCDALSWMKPSSDVAGNIKNLVGSVALASVVGVSSPVVAKDVENHVSKPTKTTVYNMSQEEITMKKMLEESFVADPNFNQYVVDPNKTKDVVLLGESKLAIDNKPSFTLNAVIINGVKYIDTMSRNDLKESLEDSYKRYSEIDYGENINNKKRVALIDKDIFELEKQKDKLEKYVKEASRNYYKYEDKLDKRIDNIYDMNKKFVEKDSTKDYSQQIEKIMELNKQIFDKREAYFGQTDSLNRSEKNEIQQELTSLRKVKNDIMYNEIPRAMRYQFEKLDKEISILEGYNQKLEQKEIDLTRNIDAISDKLNERKVLAKSEQILDYKQDAAFLDAIKEHIHYSENSDKNGKYDVAKDIGDKAGISFGAYQLTEDSGNLKGFLKEAAKVNPEAAKILKQFKGNYFNGPDSKLISFLKDFGGTELGKKLQDEYYNKHFVEKAFELIDKYEILDKSSIAQITDHFLTGGPGGALAVIKRCKGDFSPENVAAQRLKQYEAVRIAKNNETPGLGDKFIDGWTTRAKNGEEKFAFLKDENQIKINNDLSQATPINKYFDDLKASNEDINLEKSYNIERS